MNAARMTKKLIDAKIKYISTPHQIDGYCSVQTIPKCDWDDVVVFLNDGSHTFAMYKGKSLSFARGLDEARMCGKKFE